MPLERVICPKSAVPSDFLYPTSWSWFLPRRHRCQTNQTENVRSSHTGYGRDPWRCRWSLCSRSWKSNWGWSPWEFVSRRWWWCCFHFGFWECRIRSHPGQRRLHSCIYTPMPEKGWMKKMRFRGFWPVSSGGKGTSSFKAKWKGSSKKAIHLPGSLWSRQFFPLAAGFATR